MMPDNKTPTFRTLTGKCSRCGWEAKHHLAGRCPNGSGSFQVEISVEAITDMAESLEKKAAELPKRFLGALGQEIGRALGVKLGKEQIAEEAKFCRCETAWFEKGLCKTCKKPERQRDP
jgi:hypothetical protein